MAATVQCVGTWMHIAATGTLCSTQAQWLPHALLPPMINGLVSPADVPVYGAAGCQMSLEILAKYVTQWLEKMFCRLASIDLKAPSCLFSLPWVLLSSHVMLVTASLLLELKPNLPEGCCHGAVPNHQTCTCHDPLLYSPWKDMPGCQFRYEQLTVIGSCAYVRCGAIVQLPPYD